MVKKIINQILKSKTSEEILSYKSQIVDLYNELYEKINSISCSIVNFKDIKMLHDTEEHLMAYFGDCVYDKFGIPLLEEYNPETLDILDFIVLFYSLQVMSLIENGFYKDAKLSIYKHATDEIFDHTENVDLSNYNFKRLFLALWYYFFKVITIEDNTREISMEYDHAQNLFYLTDEKYEEIHDMIYSALNDSKYFCVIERILGIYRLRFTKMKYILEYQPIFVKVGYKYLCTLIDCE